VGMSVALDVRRSAQWATEVVDGSDSLSRGVRQPLLQWFAADPSTYQHHFFMTTGMLSFSCHL
jgi:hypothetical protein